MKNQTIDGVPRELLGKLAKALMIFTGHDSGPNLRHNYSEEWWLPLDAMREELRALLAAPVNPLSELEVLRAAVKDLEAMRDARVVAKLAQGEPVATPLDYGSLDAAQRLAACRGMHTVGAAVKSQRPHQLKISQ